MVQTGQIIYFSNQKIMCFDVESIEDITEPPEQIETTSVYGETRTYVPAMMNPTTLIVTGKTTLARELKHIIDTHLEVSIKPEKSNNKVSIKALEKFNNLLDEESYK